jgi:hypothetical protein
MSLSERTRRREHRNPENLEAVARHISIERKKKKKKNETRERGTTYLRFAAPDLLDIANGLLHA